MSLRVPLAVRVGSKHMTRELSGLTFREEAIGGLKYINLDLARPLDRFDSNLAAYSKITIYDGRSALPVVEGRLTDPGRSAGSDGQVWEMTGFGPAQHASDIEFPYIVIDKSADDGWRRVDSNSAGGTNSTGPRPDDSSDAPLEGIILQFPQGIPVTTNSRVTMRYERLREAGQKLGGFRYAQDAGVIDTGYDIQGVTRTNGGSGENALSATFSTAGVYTSAVVVTDFPNGRNTLDLRVIRNGAATNVADDNHWGAFVDLMIRALILNKDGAEITSGYATTYVFAHTVVNDLLGRVLDQFDGANAIVDTSGSYQIDQIAYPDGVTAGQVLEDLMQVEPTHFWTTGPDTTGGGYSFSWIPWPTTVRYEVTLAGGGNFPTSTQELYNRVLVRWRDGQGRTRTTPRTMACEILNAAGVNRQKVLDLGDEIGSAAAAIRAGDAFLADHNVPKNAGSITISQPIRDLATGRMVQPWEVKPAELIRVRGIESYPDALNASSNDGLTVFRIWSKTYSSESNTASLELDTFAHTEVTALATLANRRGRRR